MAIFFVDYTSTRAKGICGIEKLSKDDTVHIYYNLFTANLPFKVFESIRNSAANVSTIDMGFKFITEPISVTMAAMIGMAAAADCGSVAVISDNVPLCRLEPVIAKAKPKAKIVFEKSISGALEAMAPKKVDKKESPPAEKADTDQNHEIRVPAFARQASDKGEVKESDNPPVTS